MPYPASRSTTSVPSAATVTPLLKSIVCNAPVPLPPLPAVPPVPSKSRSRRVPEAPRVIGAPPVPAGALNWSVPATTRKPPVTALVPVRTSVLAPTFATPVVNERLSATVRLPSPVSNPSHPPEAMLPVASN